jgi:opacity protein-like surface antigen
MPATLGLLVAGLLAAGQSIPGVNPAPAVRSGDRVEVSDDRQSIRGRLDQLTADEVVLMTGSTRTRLPLATVQRIDRIGDPLFNGTAIGAAIGGGSALALMAKVCSNTNCADTSSNLDPRFTLVGTLIGAGVGAMIDASITGRKTVYRANTGQLLPGTVTSAAQLPPPPVTSWRHPTVFGRYGYARLTDDEGFLGSGAAWGAGLVVPVWKNIAIQVAYDRHDHRRDLESGAPPGVDVPGGFSGTEQLVTGKTLFFFRSGQAVRPYAGVGVGYMHSKRVSEFPTFVSEAGRLPVLGPSEFFYYESKDFNLGFSAGVDARVVSRLSLLGDLTIDLNHPSALGSTRLTVGAGWKF